MLGELTAQEIEDVLASQVIGRVGCHAAGRTYVVPITYAYDGECVYAHSAGGEKLRMLRANPAACLEVEQVDDLANWRSVIVRGTFEELHGEAATAGMHVLWERLSPLTASSTARPSHGLAPAGHGPTHAADTAGHAAVVHRLRLTEKTGRFERR